MRQFADPMPERARSKAIVLFSSIACSPPAHVKQRSLQSDHAELDRVRHKRLDCVTPSAGQLARSYFIYLS